jgi:ATP-binding cassette, subfamily C (CFTR/MRP), member 2
MFTGTLRFNLDPDSLNTDERIYEILNKAQLDDLLSRDDKRLQMSITESGNNLSSGER